MITINYQKYINSYYFLQDSFVGGDDYKNPRYASQTLTKTIVVDDNIINKVSTYNSYLIPHEQESVISYLQRKENAVYLNLVEPIISAYTSPLEQVKRTFTDPVMSDVFANGKNFYRGLDYQSFIKFIAEQTALFGHLFIIMDSLTDEQGNFSKLVPVVLNPIQVKEVYLSEIDLSIEGLEWERMDGTCIKVTKEGFIIEKDEEEFIIPLKEGYPFPVQVVYFKKDMSKDFPMGLSLVSDTAEIGKKIYNQSSWLNEVVKNTGFPFLALPNNMDAGEIPVESKIAVGTKNAIQYPANSGAPSYIETSGQSTEQLRQIIADEISNAFKTKGLNSFEMVDSQAASGVAIKIRNSLFESKAKTFLQNIHSLEIWIMNYLSIILGLDQVEYTIMYPVNIVAPDAASQIQNWLSLLQTAKDYGTVSPALFKLVFEQLLSQGFSLTDEQKQMFMGSVEEIVTSQTQTV